ncbi:hypothetical protein Salat_1168100 [Sesamum alatum]|uniref:Uncharacterized protein n=1 Tax=Sesamum alatum TaxID=300844 RepID=A0AAE1YFM6_9LAMI|nr:hypothetical protein Salat_1168100 [Sesamum alatum]
MFSEDKHSNTQPDEEILGTQKGSKSNTKLKGNSSLYESEVTGIETSIQTGDIGEDSGDDFNYDDPIIAELLDKDWDQELARRRSSPKDKAAHFDIASSMPGNEGGKPKEKEYTHCTNTHKHLPFIPAWSLEECESDLLETHKEGICTIYKGDTSTHQTIGPQETEEASDREEEVTPLFNRFQSLQNMEEQETQLIDLQSHEEETLNACEAGDTKHHHQNSQSQEARIFNGQSIRGNISGIIHLDSTGTPYLRLKGSTLDSNRHA